LLTRNGLDWTHRLGLVVKELAKLEVQNAIIDGEAIVRNDRGISEFHALQRELKKGSHARIAVMAFDLLHLDGLELRDWPLRERKDLLRDLLGKSRSTTCAGLSRLSAQRRQRRQAKSSANLCVMPSCNPSTHFVTGFLMNSILRSPHGQLWRSEPGGCVKPGALGAPSVGATVSRLSLW
jgi:hypothetical protein